jgi:lipopolysaccharide export LptBFGC system permease protein LptF
MLTLMELTVVLVLCPAALAIWADARYPNLRPRELRRTTIHLGIGGLLAFVLMRPLLVGIATLVSGAAGQAAAIVAACVVITYCLTVSVWIVRWATDTMRAGN